MGRMYILGTSRDTNEVFFLNRDYLQDETYFLKNGHHHRFCLTFLRLFKKKLNFFVHWKVVLESFQSWVPSHFFKKF